MAVLERIDPAFLPILKVVPIIDLVDIHESRAALHAVFAQMGTGTPDPAVERFDRLAPGRAGQPDARVRVFRPAAAASAPRPCLVWILGGGYVLTALDVDDRWCEQIARSLDCVVVSVDWRRAPEHPFPAAAEDCYAGLVWAAKNADALGIDAERIVVGGASSGGGAAAAVALMARDRKEVRVAHQLLIYPMLDDRNTTRASYLITDPELWNRGCNERAWRAYLGDDYGTDRVSPYAAPARMKDLSGLPPATVLTGELDLFVDEDIAYAQRLMAENIPTELHVYPAVHHGFDRHLPTAAVSQRFYADRDAALRRAFAR